MNPEEVLEKYMSYRDNGELAPTEVELYVALEQAVALIAAINTMSGPEAWDLLQPTDES